MSPYLGENFEWIANANAIEMARGIEVIRRMCYGDNVSEEDKFAVAHVLGGAAIPSLEQSRQRVSEQCAPWFEISKLPREEE
jgi:hypothetical protein